MSSLVVFSDLFNIPLRNGVTKPKKVRGTGYKMVNMGELFANSIIDNVEMDRVPLTETEKNTLLEKGDLLFARQSLVREGAGKCSIFIDDIESVCFESHIIRCRLKKSIANPLFYYYFFKSPLGKEKIASIVEQGAGAAGIRGSDLQRIKVPYLPINIQNLISDCLYAFDQKIQLNTQINQTLEQIAQAIFKSWFVDFDPVKAKIDALANGGTHADAERAAMQVISGKTNAELTQMQQTNPDAYKTLEKTAALFPSEMVESELGEVPKGWGISTVGDVAQITKGKSYKSEELQPSKTALVTLKSFNRGGGYRLDGLKEYTGTYKENQEVFSGDLIIAYTDVTQAADVIGKPAMVMSDSKYEHLVISLDVGVVRPNNNIYKYFLYCLAMTDNFQSHTKAFCTGTTVLHLSKDAVPSFKFCNPNENLLEAFDCLSSSIFLKINNTIEENKRLIETRDALLPKLLSGRMEV
ncbi:restriction endonuclease subunit S [Pasteurella multocida]